MRERERQQFIANVLMSTVLIAGIVAVILTATMR